MTISLFVQFSQGLEHQPHITDRLSEGRMERHKQRIWLGHPFPLGATWDGSGTNFALFSAHAERVELCLFDREGKQELERISPPEYTNEVWNDALFGYVVGHDEADLSFDKRDSAPYLPKCEVIDPSFLPPVGYRQVP